LFQATHQEPNNDNELIRQLKTKIKEQENSISEVSSAVERFLKIQPIVKKLQVNISKISNHVVPNVPQDKFKVTVPKIGDSEIVKPFTPPLEKPVVMTKQRAMKEMQESADNRLKRLIDDTGLRPGDPAYDKVCKMHWKSHNKEMEKLKRLPDNVESGTSDEKSQCQDTSADTMKHPITRLALMATLKKQSRVASIASDSDSGSPTDSQSASEQNDGEQEYNSSSISDRDSSQDDSSDNSGAEPETSQDDSLISIWDRYHISRKSAEDSQESDTETSPPPSIDTRKKFNKSRGDESKDKSQRYKEEDSFVVPKYSKEDRAKAYARIQAALNQVDQAVHFKSRGERKHATLYVGNLEFNASEQDLRKALDRLFKKVRVEEVTIPRVNGRSKYGFIEISWAHRAPVQILDLCIIHSGMIQVNSRPIYLRELRDKGNKQ
jgi:hypothetical protein